jgi:MarR family transcriptional regulator, 2-MHQ and catechol-resistance regulon repressor
VDRRQSGTPKEGLIQNAAGTNLSAEPRASLVLDREDPIARLALRYLDEYNWVDTEAIMLCLRTDAASAAHKAATARLFQSLGLERTMGRYAVLRILYFAPEGRMPQSEVGNDINVTSSNVTYLVDGLEKIGLVRRLPDPNDRRSTFIELTSEGRSVCDRLVPSMADFMRSMGRGFTEEEKALFNSFLERLRANAEQLGEELLGRVRETPVRLVVKEPHS